MDMSELIPIFSINVKFLDRPKMCVWKNKTNLKLVCSNPVSHLIIEPTKTKAIAKVKEGIIVHMGYYCIGHFSDTFPELAIKEGIYN